MNDLNQKNFNSLKNIKAPQAWLEKAAAIPEESPRTRVFPLYRITAAAAIVMVSAVGLLVFLLMGDGKAPIATRSGGVVTESAADGAVGGKTEESGSPAPAETVAVLSTDADGNTVITYREKPSPTVNDPQPTGGRIDPSVSIPTDVPTVPSTERHPAPTEAPAPTSASQKPTAPPATQKPTEGYKPPGDTEFYGTFSIADTGVASGSGYSYAAEDLTVFCRLYDSSGRLVGDSPLYHPQREATILSSFSDGTVLVYYNPVDKGLSVTEDGYEYVFYDVHGNELYRSIKFVF